MKKLIVLICILIYANRMYGQLNNIWLFGDSTGIDFSNNPTPVTSNINGIYENFSNICDANGNLLFYLQYAHLPNLAGQVYNVVGYDGDTLENGDSLLTDVSETQGSIIVPMPGENNLYAVFYIQFPGVGNQGLYYSVVDMNANNGKGKVISKNIRLIDQTLSEKISAVKHGNGTDWWVITHASNSSAWVRFLVTQDSIKGPFTQCIGSYVDTILVCCRAGQCKFSESGNKFTDVNMYGHTEIYDFDRCTGKLSNYIELGEVAIDSITNCSNGTYYGCSISDDGRFLYVSDRHHIYQFDLQAPNILLSKTLLAQTPSQDDSYFGQHQLGPDGKIYISSGYYSFPTVLIDSANTYLSVINEPDSAGLSCSAEKYSFYMDGHTFSLGLPNFPNYNLGSLPDCTGDSIYDEHCDLNTSVFLPAKEIVSLQILPSVNNGICAFNFSFTSPSANISILDLYGREIESYHVTSAQTISFSHPEMPSGIYFVKMIAGNQTIVKKFIKQ